MGGVDTRYYEEGEGEPIVLMHGGDYGFVAALDTWSLNLKPLATSFHVYAFDKLGQGHTGIPSRDEDYTYDAVVRHATAWMEAVGVRDAHLVGHSRGALLAISLALEGRAKTLVLVNSATLRPSSADPGLDAAPFYAAIDARVPPGPPSREGLRLEPEANAYSTAHVTDEYIERYLEIARLPAQLQAKAKMRERLKADVFMPNLALRRHEILERVASGLPVRTLLVWSRNDPSASFQHVGLPLWNLLAEKTHDVELHVFNKAGHYSFRECAPEFNRLVTAFCLR